MEKKNGIIIKVGTALVLLLAIGLVFVAVLARPARNAQEQTLPLLSNVEEDVLDENAIREPNSDSEDYEIYVVQRGATLSVIAKAYSEAYGKTITVQDIKDVNGLENIALIPGQELKIPKK